MLISLKGRCVYYDLTGPEAGPVVCFTHSLASDSGMWAEQLPPLLAAGFRVLRLDMRGHGGSETVAGHYTMSALAGDVAAAIDALGLDRVHYVGLSIGGMIGQGFALEHGAKLRSLMLCDTLPSTLPDAKAAWAPRIEAVTKANSLAPIADATMDRWFTGAFKPRNPQRWQQIRDTVAETSPSGFLGCAAAILDFDWVLGLRSLKVPTLVVCGGEDPGTPPAQNRRIAELVPGARYEEIANARHFPNVERAEAFNEILLGWLKARR
ncbi:MAG TPA: alpha/beta fold hydrolase [Stellaceae bacterium]|jgi:3-oxoadipate enol-lactonase|nr:alpha/beta fold hydrolase [Stellaceae bacterium]